MRMFDAVFGGIPALSEVLPNIPNGAQAFVNLSDGQDLLFQGQALVSTAENLSGGHTVWSDGARLAETRPDALGNEVVFAPNGLPAGSISEQNDGSRFFRGADGQVTGSAHTDLLGQTHYYDSSGIEVGTVSPTGLSSHVAAQAPDVPPTPIGFEHAGLGDVTRQEIFTPPAADAFQLNVPGIETPSFDAFAEPGGFASVTELPEFGDAFDGVDFDAAIDMPDFDIDFQGLAMSDGVGAPGLEVSGTGRRPL